MKKLKIAVLGSGWSSTSTSLYIKGIERGFKDIPADIYAFIGYPINSNPDIRLTSCSVFFLPNFDDYDGIIVISSSINYPEILDKIIENCKRSGKPVISHGKYFDGVINDYVENKTGMECLVDHLIHKHNIRKPVLICGQKGHPDSDIREKVVISKFEECGIRIPLEDIFYSDWENPATVKYLTERMKNGPKPDAIICANDGLAMATSYELEALGFKVPEDILITGFDNLPEAQTFFPRIATVDQPHEELGFLSARRLLDEINGARSNENITVDCRFIPGESCGCINETDNSLIRAQACRGMFVSRLETVMFNNTFSILGNAIGRSKNMIELKKNVGKILKNEFLKENETFHIIIDPYFYTTKKTNLTASAQYNDRLTVLFSATAGKNNKDTEIEKEELFPKKGTEAGNSTYIITALFDEKHPIGYFAAKNYIGKMENHMLEEIQRHLMDDLNKHRKERELNSLNDELTVLAQKDALTSVKNRIAYDETVSSISKKIESDRQTKVAVAMFDINNLKSINDEMGHRAGDEYIKNCTHFICSIYPLSPVFRIGGDEFCAIITGSEYDDRYERLEKGRTLMQSYYESLALPREKRISIASGLTEFDPRVDNTFQDAFNRADSLMYEDKKKMKAAMKKN